MNKARLGPTIESCDTGWSLIPAAPSEAPRTPSLPVAVAGREAAEATPAPAPEPEDTSAPCLEFDGQTLYLRGTLDIYQAARLHRELLAIAAAPPPSLTVDVTHLERIDAAAAQVLLAFRREVPRAVIVRPPDPVRERLERVGVWQQL